MTYNFVVPKTVLGNGKSQSWKCFMFCVVGDNIDWSFAHCVLYTRIERIKYCSGTTNITNYILNLVTMDSEL